jgi:hypothetical protein
LSVAAGREMVVIGTVPVPVQEEQMAERVRRHRRRHHR